MASPESSSPKSKQVAADDHHEDEPREEEEEEEEKEAEEEEYPPSSIDIHLVDALDDPRYATTLLHMESMMQQLITQQPDPYEVYFAPGSTTELLRLGSILAFHYKLQPYVGRGIRLIAKKTPESRIPAVTLSGISNQRRRRSGGTSSSGTIVSSAVETAKVENLEKGKGEEGMAEERNEEDKISKPLSDLSLQGTAESEKPLTGITLKEMKNEEKSPAPVDTNPADVIQLPQVHDTLVSNPVSSEVSSSNIPPAVMIKSKAVSSSTSAKFPEGGRPAARQSSSSNRTFKSTTSVNQSGRGTSLRGPVTGHHHSQGMQQRGGSNNVSQPSASAPNTLPYGNYIVYNPYHASSTIYYYPAYSEQLPGQQYTQTYYVPNHDHASNYRPTYSDYTQVQYPHQPVILVSHSPQHGASTSHSQPSVVQYPQPIYPVRPLVQYPQAVFQVPQQHAGASTSQPQRPLRGRVQRIDREGMDRLLDEHDQHFPDLFSQDAIDAEKADP